MDNSCDLHKFARFLNRFSAPPLSLPRLELDGMALQQVAAGRHLVQDQVHVHGLPQQTQQIPAFHGVIDVLRQITGSVKYLYRAQPGGSYADNFADHTD